MEKKFRLLLLLALLMTAATGAWATDDTWVEVVFTQAIEANDLAENATFTADGSSFSVTLADKGNKMVIDAHACRFGTSTGYKLYSYRLKSNGASSSTKNYLILNIPEAGKLRVAPRSASNTATDHTLKIEQGETVLYNDIVQESQAISISENEQEVKVYPYVEVPVTAGSVRVSYSAAMNIYGFGFSASSSSGGSGDQTYTVSMKDDVKDADKWTVKVGEGEAQAFPVEGLEGGEKITVTYSGKKKVKSVTATTDAPYAANEYNYASWNYTLKKVEFTKQTAPSVTAVTNSDTGVTWGDGWYTVSGKVTITGNVTLGSNTSLILQDGATLTINGQLNASDNDLYIYGQMEGTGKLNVTCNDDAIKDNGGYCLRIHGGEITATATGADHRGVYFGYIAMFGGKLTATAADYHAIGFNTWGFAVYGGEVEGTSNATGNFSGILSGGSLSVYGGKVKGTGGAPSGKGFDCKVQSGTSNIKFYFSDNGTTWGDGETYEDVTLAPGNRYAKAE